MADIEISPVTTVNATTAGYQAEQSVTALADGGWVVTWMSYANNSDYDVYQQRYDANGNVNGPEILVNTTIENGQNNPVTTGLVDGGWVVAWFDSNGNGSIRTQRYDATGAPSGPEQTLTSGNTYSNAIEIEGLADGGWVMSRVEYNQSISKYEILTDRYDSNGGFVETVTVSALDNYGRATTEITSLPDGGYLVTWQMQGDMMMSNDGNSVYQQRYGSDGIAAGPLVTVYDSPSNWGMGNNDSPSVTVLEDGGWVVAWSEYSAGSFSMQRYGADGTPAGNVISLPNATYSNLNPSVAATPDGGWVMVYSLYNNDTAYDIFLQRYDADGNAVGEPLTVSDAPQSEYRMDLAVLNDGNIVITWHNDGYDSNGGNNPDAGDIKQTIVNLTKSATIELSEDGSHPFTAGEFDFSVDSDSTLVSITITAVPDNGTLTLNGVAVEAGKVIPAADLAGLVWKPDADDNGTGLATLKFTSLNSQDETKSAQVKFDVTAVNDDPTSENGTATLDEDASYTFSAADFAFADVDTGDAFAAIIISTLPASGTLELDGEAVTINQEISVADISKLVWTPAENANGEGLASLGFKVTDGNGGTSIAHTITFDVNAQNDAPSSEDNTAVTATDRPYAFSGEEFAFNDIDTGDTLLSIRIGALPSAGTLTLDGIEVEVDQEISAENLNKLVWTPPVGTAGNALAFIDFAVMDSSRAASETKRLTFDVIPNVAPVAVDDVGTMKEGKTVAFDVLANDTDADDNILSVTDAVVSSENGTVTIGQDGKLSVSYTGVDLDPGKKAIITVTYTLSDGIETDTGQLVVTVKGVAEPGDDIIGTPKNDTLIGTNVGERIVGQAGNDVIKGNGGDDNISGLAGNDIIDGGNGNDKIGGGSGNDKINGGNGNDIIAGWSGNDVLTGGKGADTFVFDDSSNRDRITDFGNGADKIDLSEVSGINSFKQLKAHMTEVKGDTVIDLPGGSVTLEDVRISELSKSDFLF
ncbi:Ig-like domain-containing protein [Rhizobium sp.]